jgi:PAS domain S-box-containing protein
MSRSPEYIRLATNVSRSLADTAFDCIREAVVVVDARRKHLPIVLANAAARRRLTQSEGDAGKLLESSLYELMSPASASALQAMLAPLKVGLPASRPITWRLATVESALATEIKLLPGPQGQRWVMLTFAPPAAQALGEAALALEQLPFDILILDRELKVTYANPGAVRTAGRASAGLLGLEALTLAPTSALPQAVYCRALEGCHYHDDSLELVAPTARKRLFEIDVQPFKDSTGIVGLLVLSAELRERRLLKSPKVANDRRLRALTEHARDIITVAGQDGKLQYVSGGIRNALGYTSEERRSNHILDHVHPDDQLALRTKFEELASGEIAAFSREYRVRHKDGTYRWLEASYVSALANPLINGVVVNSRDITERKQAETRLAQREEVFRLAAEAVDGIIFEWDLNRGIVHRSRGLLEILGMEPEDLAPSTDAWVERIHPHDMPVFQKLVATALMHERGWTTTYRIRDARGRYRSMLDRGLIQRSPEGDAVRAIGWCVDISEVKRLTDLLAETQRTAQMGGWEYSYVTRELNWTDEMYRIYETSRAEFQVSLDSVLKQCTPESRCRAQDAWEQAQEDDGQLDVELEIMTFKKQRIWVRLIGHMERLDGKLFRAFGSLQNIQSQKLAQIALENSTDWLKLSMNMANMHAWRWDKRKDAFEFAIVDGQAIHLPTVFPAMQQLLSRVHPRDRAAVTRAVETAFERRGEVQAEFRLKVNDGRYRSYATIARPLFDALGVAEGLVGVTQDVTGRREAEAQLRRSEQLLRTTTANTADTLMLVDTHLMVRFINKGVGERTSDQIVGAAIASLLPEAARAMVIQKLKHVLATGESSTYEFDCKGSGPDTQYFENRAVVVRDEGIGTAISISMRDITERKRLEQEILEVSSRERQTIGRDLHDGLGQELTGVALMLRGLATRVQRQSPGIVDYINEIVGLVNQSIESARSLARGLLPVRTDTGGLPFALRALAARSRDLYGLEVNFRPEVGPDMTLSEACSSHLYRIAQEALTNAARHGHATQVEIFLTITRNSFSLRITDNGGGIGKMNKSATGMGLKIMRYRADMIGAKFEIEPNEPYGTVVRVTGERPAMIAPLGLAHAT